MNMQDPPRFSRSRSSQFRVQTCQQSSRHQLSAPNLRPTAQARARDRSRARVSQTLVLHRHWKTIPALPWSAVGLTRPMCQRSLEIICSSCSSQACKCYGRRFAFLASTLGGRLDPASQLTGLSLTLPMSQRPHPCLLYAMYLMASKLSPSPAIRALEPHFHSIASRQLSEAILQSDRLFDAVRAASILAVYYFSLGRYIEGFTTTGTASWLGVACGLNQIPSSTHRPSTMPSDRRAGLAALMRQRSYVLLAPADPIELGERIWAFWTLYTVSEDRPFRAELASDWSSVIYHIAILAGYSG